MKGTEMSRTPAEALMTEFNAACRKGSLSGGKLAYTAAGPGEWFTAGTLIERTPGVHSLAVAPGRRLSRADAEQLIRDASAG